MKGFRDGKIFDPIKGHELTQVCIGANEVILRFHPDSSITVFSLDRFYEDNDEFINDVLKNNIEKSVFGKKIEDFHIENKQIAYLTLSENYKIKLTDDSEQYESIVVSGKFGDIVI